ncbi:MAG: EAL domain-containing protein, partial [Sulfurimonas sp.]|nr:EAL domain-containing protein [Sulfurimonas sp.]
LLVLARFTLHYLVFHSFAEYFAIFVSLSITLVTYYTYAFTKNRYLLYIGLGYFWIAFLDIMHTQTYMGMNLYNVDNTNISTTFWIFARIFEASILLTAPFMRYVKYAQYQLFFLFGMISTVLIVIAMNAPLTLFVAGEGLTSLKISLEYLVIAMLLLTLYINKRHANEFIGLINKAMQYSIIFTICAEASFTFYSDVYGIMNVIGHSFKFLSFWILLQAIIRTSLQEPFKVMQQSSTTYDAMPYPAIVIDNKGIVRQVNQVACKVINKNASEIIGQRNHELYHPRSISEALCPVCQSIAKRERLHDYELEDKDLNTIKQYSLSPVQSQEGNVQGMVQVSIDVTHARELKDSLANQKSLLENIIDTVPIRIFWKDNEGVYLGANRLFVQDAQLNASDELIGKSDFEMPWSETEAQIYRDDDLAVIRSGKAKLQFEETQTTDEGETIILSTSKVLLKNTEGETIGTLGTYEDITKRKEDERKLVEQQKILEYQAHYDVLTNLPNRTLLQDRLTHAVERSKRNTTNFALLFIDLDEFKQINDTLGHQIGDEVLKVLSKRFKTTIREEDTLARQGGDEFMLLLEDVQSAEDVAVSAQKVMDQTVQAIAVDEHVLHVSASIGISVYPDDSTDINDLFKYADIAMYKAKEEGKNNFQFYSSELTVKAVKRAAMQADLREALENEDFEVYYQPQIAVGKTEDILIGCEALVRWRHKTRGLISPMDFIPLAEETGMIVELDRLVMKMAIKQISVWYKEGLNPGILSLNLAMKQLQQDDFISTVHKIIEESGCEDKTHLAFEITESGLMQDPESSIEKLNMLKELGIEIAIDDFGTGYSSLAYLKRLPVNKLKIDQSFTSSIPADKDDMAIVKAIISLSKSLNMKTIAEGVETQAQKEFMCANGCDEIQGYLYSKPLISEEMRAFIVAFK